MPNFTIEHLGEDRLYEAWPMVRMSDAHVNTDWWISEATALIRRGGGILAARGPDGIIYGVATYEVARKERLGRVLAIDMLITFELSRRAPVRHAICDALDLLASAFDCRKLVLPLPSKAHVEHRARSLHGVEGFDPSPDIA